VTLALIVFVQETAHGRFPMNPVSVNLLGRCELRLAVGDSKPVTNTRTALLMARLAMPPGQSHDRKRITVLLWPDRGEAQAMASLRQLLWTLRKETVDSGPPLIIADRSSLRLAEATDVDAMQFEQLIRSGTAADLERAAELYRGDYLAGVDLDDMDAHSPFLFERQRLRELALSGMKTLVGLRTLAGDADGALEIAKKGLAIDPLQEDVHAAIIRLHLEHGRLGLARDQYEACRDILRRELDIAPSTEIEALRGSFGSVPDRQQVQKTSPLTLPATRGRQMDTVTPAKIPGRWALAAAGLAAVVALPLIFNLWRVASNELPTHPAAAAARPSLVVLPFEDGGNAGLPSLFASGLSDSLIANLSKVSGLFVISGETSRLISDASVPARQQAAKLGVGYAVKGRIDRTRNPMGVAVELIDAGTGNAIWRRHYDWQVPGLYLMQGDMVRQIASSLDVQLTDRERRSISRVPTRSLEAQDFYLRAEYQPPGIDEGDGFRRVLAAYRRAAELDPDFADAYAGYARVAAVVWRRYYDEILSSAVARREAYAAADKAMQLDPENARAWEVLSIIQAVEGEHEVAVASARQAIAFQPGDAEAHANIAAVQLFAGDLDAAAAEIKIARELNPAPGADLLLTSAMLAFAQRRYPAAIEEFTAIEKLVPRSDLVLEHLAAAYAYLGDQAKAKEIASQLKELVPTINLQLYSVMTENVGTVEQKAHFIDGLRRAGIPEWPFDDRRSETDRLSQEELRKVMAGPVWKGQLQNGVVFVQYFGNGGSFAYKSRMTLLKGRAEIRNGLLCQFVEGYLMNRPSCGYVVRSRRDDPPGTYVYISIDAVKYFSVFP
jgi:adenylate cyclase